MSEALVLIPRSLAPPALPDGALLVHFPTAFDAAIALRASEAPAVLVTDGLDAEDLDSLATAIRERPGFCVEVRSANWDGETHSAISAVCRGVISGFGADGIRRAAEFVLTPPG